MPATADQKRYRDIKIQIKFLQEQLTRLKAERAELATRVKKNLPNRKPAR